ncbi:MAG: hypothetical protein ACPGF8_01535 [Opitutales bacterium]
MLPPATKRRINPMLIQVIVISVILHVVIGLILGGITVIDHIIPDKAQFDEAPETPEEAPPPPPVKVEVKPQKPKQVLAPKLNLRPVGNIAVADVSVDLPDMQQNFTVSSGLGAGSLQISGGSLLGVANGSLKLGMSEVNVFGLKSKSERILFIIDSSRGMLTDKKGGLNSYKVIKDKVTELISNLAPGTLFNVILTDDLNKSILFQPKLVSSGIENQIKLIKWFASVNVDANKVGIGHLGANKRPLTSFADSAIVTNLISQVVWRANQNAYFTQLALEMNADSIFHICSQHNGFHGTRRLANERELARNQKDRDRITQSSQWKKLLAAHKAEIPIMQKRIDATLAKQNAARKKKGLPPRVLLHTGVIAAANELGLKWNNPMPSFSTFGINFRNHHPIKASELKRHFGKVVRELYTKKKKRIPNIHILLLLAGDSEISTAQEKNITEFTRTFKGKLRIVKGLDEIKTAAKEEN